MTFTRETPTVPGAYWWKGYSDAIPRLIEVFTGPDGGMWHEGGNVESLGGLWCRLVPAEEVDNLELIKASTDLVELVEGVGSERWVSPNGFRFKDTTAWVKFYVVARRAKRVVEGGE